MTVDLAETDGLLHRIDAETAKVERARQMREAPDPFDVGDHYPDERTDELLFWIGLSLAASCSPYYNRPDPYGYVPGESYDGFAPVGCSPEEIRYAVTGEVTAARLVESFADLGEALAAGWRIEINRRVDQIHERIRRG